MNFSCFFDAATLPDLGPVFTEYKNNPEGAIKRLMAERTGDARAVVERGDIGTIDLIYGNSKGGLAHIAMKHPEIIGMLPSLLRNGKLVKKPGARKVFLISERDPADVVVVALDWYGAAKTWVVTSYADVQGLFTGGLKTMNTESLDSVKVDILYTGQWTKEILGHEMQTVNTFDSTTAPMSALARLKLLKELSDNRRERNSLGDGAMAAMKRLKLVKRGNEIRALLGMNAAVAKPPEPQATGTVQPTEADGMQATTPEPKPEEQNPHVKALQDLAAGTPADAEPEGPIELTGKEFGDFPDTHEGRGELRKVVEENFRNILGKTFYSRALNAEVELRDSKQTPAKFFFKNFNPKKLKSVAAIGHLIRNGVKFKPSGKPYDKSDTNTKLYHYLRTEFVLDGELLAARIVVKEDVDGHFHYDHTIHQSSVVLDNAGNGYGPEGPLHPLKEPTGVYGTQVGRLGAHLISVEDGDDYVLLDSTGQGGRAFVFNLFIEGEEPEVVEAEDVEDDDALSDDPNSPNYRYKDTGYIADSRKEKAADTIMTARKKGQRLRASDIDFDALEQNPRQAKEMVVKANLFGKTDWQALQDSGMEPAAGFLIDKIYSSIAPEPGKDSPDERRDYAMGLESIRDRLQDKKTVDEVLAVVNEIKDELNGVSMSPSEAEEYELLTERMRELGAERKALDDSSKAIYAQMQVEEVAKVQAQRVVDQRQRRGWSVSAEQQQTLGEATAKVDALRAQFVAIRGDVNPRIEAIETQLTNLRRQREVLTMVSRARNLKENPSTRAWLTFGERFIKLTHYRSYQGSETFAGHVTNAKAGKIQDWSWADKERPTVPKEATRQEVNFQLRVAEQFERRGGKPVQVNSTRALKDMLGLRDVQSGNWVLKDPNSAKFHVEQTAGAMSDLADVLDIDVAALGLGGRLGMAFGARGTGGKNAARAHYESVHRVINLTKMGGGGCLGHELFHAIDNILHELVKQEVSGAKGDFVTNNPDLLPPGAIKDAVMELRQAMLTGNARLTERIAFTDQDVKQARYNIERPRNAIATAIKGAGNAQDAVLAVDANFAGRSDARSLKNRKVWRKMAAAFYAKEGETSVDLPTGPAVSNFAKEAQVLDGGTYGKYWSETEEMAARGFQAWLEDKLASMDRRNDYLSVFADNKYHVDPLLGIEWKPYPEGEERVRINAAFERLFAAIRQAQVFEKASQNTALLDSIFLK